MLDQPDKAPYVVRQNDYLGCTHAWGFESHSSACDFAKERSAAHPTRDAQVFAWDGHAKVLSFTYRDGTILYAE